MTVRQLITALEQFDCDNADIVGFLEGKGEFEIKPIKYVLDEQDERRYRIVITSNDYNPFKEVS